MTKKHFIVIADIIRNAKIESKNADMGWIAEIGSRLGDYFATENERFDEDEFNKACNV